MSKACSRIVVRENNRSFTVVVEKGSDSDKLHIDDGAFADRYPKMKARCDYAIRVSPSLPQHFFLIELKGNDVIRAAEQIRDSILPLQTLHALYKDRQAWVIAGGWRPAVSTRWQVVKKRVKELGFNLSYKTQTHTVDLTK